MEFRFKNISISMGRLIVMIIMMATVVVGGTFAWFTYQSRQTALVLTVGELNDTQITLTPYQINTVMAPGTTYSSGVKSDVNVQVGTGINNSSVVLYYKINQLDTTLINKGLSYTVRDSSNTTVASGKFSDLIDTSKTLPEEVVIFNTKAVNGAVYSVYLWVDSSVGNQNDIQNTTLDMELNASIGRVVIMDPSTGKEVTAPLFNQTLSTSMMDMNTEATYSYQWYSNTANSTTGGTPISGATGTSYTVGSGLVGKYIYVEITVNDPKQGVKTYADITSKVKGIPLAVSWAAENGDGTLNSDTSKWEYTYNGKARAPIPSVSTGMSGITMALTRTTGTDAASYTSKASCSSVSVNIANFTAICSDFALSNTSQSLVISPKAFAITWSYENEYIYNALEQAPVPSGSTGVDGETMTLSYNKNINAGTGYVSTVSCGSISGGRKKCANYTLSNTSSNAYTIEKRILILANVTASNKTYNGSDAATCTITLGNVATAEATTPTVTYTGKFSSPNAGAKNTVTCSNITLANKNNWRNNYELASTSKTTTATINQKPVTVSWTGDGEWKTRPYYGWQYVEGAPARAPYAVTPVTVVTGESITLSTSATPQTAPGKYSATASCTSVTGDSSAANANPKCSNYSFNSTMLTWNIKLGDNEAEIKPPFDQNTPDSPNWEEDYNPEEDYEGMFQVLQNAIYTEFPTYSLVAFADDSTDREPAVDNNNDGEIDGDGVLDKTTYVNSSDVLSYFSIDDPTSPTLTMKEGTPAGDYVVYVHIYVDGNDRYDEKYLYAIINVRVNKIDNTMVLTEPNQSWNPKYKTSTQSLSYTGASYAEGSLTYSIWSQKNASGETGSWFTLSGTTLKMKASTPVSGSNYVVEIRVCVKNSNNYLDDCEEPGQSNSGNNKITITVDVDKASNPIKVTGSQTWPAFDYSTTSVDWNFSPATNAVGDVTYSITSQLNKSDNSTVSNFTLGFDAEGNPFLRAKAKALPGTYTIVITVHASGDGSNGNYLPSDPDPTITVSLTINKIPPPSLACTTPQSKTVNYSTSVQYIDFAGPTNAEGSVTYVVRSCKNSNGTSVSTFSIPTNTTPRLKMNAKTTNVNDETYDYTIVVRATSAATEIYKSTYCDMTINVTVDRIPSTIEVENPTFNPVYSEIALTAFDLKDYVKNAVGNVTYSYESDLFRIITPEGGILQMKDWLPANTSYNLEVTVSESNNINYIPVDKTMFVSVNIDISPNPIEVVTPQTKDDLVYGGKQSWNFTPASKAKGPVTYVLSSNNNSSTILNSFSIDNAEKSILTAKANTLPGIYSLVVTTCANVDVNHPEYNPNYGGKCLDITLNITIKSTIDIEASQSWPTIYSTSSQTKEITPATNVIGNVTYSISSQTNKSGTTVSYFSLSINEDGTPVLSMNANTPVSGSIYNVKIEACDDANGGINSYETCKEVSVSVTVAKKKLPTPTNVAINTYGQLTWDPVVEATEYHYKINDSSWVKASSSGTTTLKDMRTALQPSSSDLAVYTPKIFVIAKNSDTANYTESDASTPITATLYRITPAVNNSNMGTLNYTTPYYVLKGTYITVSSNKKTLYIKGLKTDDVVDNVRYFTVTPNDGYEVSSWSYEEGTITSALNLTANLKGKSVSVNLDANGGKFFDDATTKSITVTFGQAYGTLSNPSRDTYTFDGWYDANGVKVTSSTIVSNASAHTLTAKWNDTTAPSNVMIMPGVLLNGDPSFISSTITDISSYLNDGAATVNLSRVSISGAENYGNTSGYGVKITTTASSDGVHGGFTFNTQSSANKVYVTRIVAKIPVGYNIEFGSGSIGSNFSGSWLTSNAGTGDWEEYVYFSMCGSSGEFELTNHFYLVGGNAATSSNPLVWYVAHAALIDASLNYDNYVIAVASDNVGITGYKFGLGLSSQPADGDWDSVESQKAFSPIVTSPSTGKYWIWVKDAAGNVESFNIDVDIDDTPPSINNFVVTANGSNITAVVDASDSQSGIKNYYFALVESGAECAGYSSSDTPVYNFTGRSNGTYKVCVYMEDNEGNIGKGKGEPYERFVNVTVENNTLSKHIEDLYDNGSHSTVSNNSVSYYQDTTNLILNDGMGLGGAEPYNSGNLRYYGGSPNNYVYFNCDTYPSTNCEIWRIVGVFTVDGVRKVKLMRGSSAGKATFDNKDFTLGTNDGSTIIGSPAWYDSRLLALLNPSQYSGHIGDTIYSSSFTRGLYYNRSSGSCYLGRNANQEGTCDFTTTGLKNSLTRSMISPTTWNLGRVNVAENRLFANQLYSYERGDFVLTGADPTWTGKVALIHASDFAYSMNLNTCTTNVRAYGDNSGCYNNQSWIESLYDDNEYTDIINTLTAYNNQSYAFSFNLHDASYGISYINTSEVSYVSPLYPSIYLEPDVTVVGGNGSSSSPYQLSYQVNDGIVPVINNVDAFADSTTSIKINVDAFDYYGIKEYYYSVVNENDSCGNYISSTDSTYTKTGLTNGNTYKVCVYVKDNNNNNSSVVSKTVKVAAIPTCTISGNNSGLTATYVVNDPNATIEYYGWDSSYTGTNTLTKALSGVGEYVFYVKDSNGNKGSCSATISNTTPYCSTGGTVSGDGCIYYVPVISRYRCTYSCGSSFELESSCPANYQCADGLVGTITNSTPLGLTCPSGYNLSNGTCYTTSAASYSCNGKIMLNNSYCFEAN